MLETLAQGGKPVYKFNTIYIVLILYAAASMGYIGTYKLGVASCNFKCQG